MIKRGSKLDAMVRSGVGDQHGWQHLRKLTRSIAALASALAGLEATRWSDLASATNAMMVPTSISEAISMATGASVSIPSERGACPVSTSCGEFGAHSARNAISRLLPGFNGKADQRPAVTGHNHRPAGAEIPQDLGQHQLVRGSKQRGTCVAPTVRIQTP
jgi:hypothetical protein